MPYKPWDDDVVRKHSGIRRRLTARRPTGVDRQLHPGGSPPVASSNLSLRLLQIRYRINSLRVLTMLVRIGFPRPWAMALARWWEGVRHPWARSID